MGNAIEITADNFAAEIEGASGVSIVDFGATWCGPCQALAPTIEALADEYADKGVKIGKCDVDQAPELSARFGIMSVPTILFFRDGEKIESVLGNQPKDVLKARIDELIAG